MKTYDVIVIGSGCGNIVADYAASNGMRVALVDGGTLGGTCLNTGCIPSKMLIYSADRVVDIQEAERFGIRVRIEEIDFGTIMDRMKQSISKQRSGLRERFLAAGSLDLYEAQGTFVADHTLEVQGERLWAKKVFIASGTRPLIPPIKGLDKVPYLTNESVLCLTSKPDSLIIIGGGYIAAEYAHFFAAMGTKVTMVEMADRLLLAEDAELSDVLRHELSARVTIHLHMQTEEIQATEKSVAVMARDGVTGKASLVEAQSLMVAVGRRSNADTLNLAATGIETDERSFIRVNDYLETTSPGIYAIGDANGRQMFRHAANRQGFIVLRNAFAGERIRFNDLIIPHAVFTHPQIAGVGLTEEAARRKHDVVVGRTRYIDTAKGEAMMDTMGFAKVILDKGTGWIIGFHVIGPQAPELVQEVANAMTSGGQAAEIAAAIHIHPALSEVVADTFYAATGRSM